MRIEAYNQVQQIYNSTRARSTAAASKTERTDKVQISSFGQELQIAREAVKAAPDVRENIVSPIRTAVQNGTYNVSDSDFADRILNKISDEDSMI